MEKGALATPAFPGVTKEEAARLSAIANENNQLHLTQPGIQPYEYSTTEQVASPAIPAQPDKEVTRPATKAEYDLCLRQNGL